MWPSCAVYLHLSGVCIDILLWEWQLVLMHGFWNGCELISACSPVAVQNGPQAIRKCLGAPKRLPTCDWDYYFLSCRNLFSPWWHSTAIKLMWGSSSGLCHPPGEHMHTYTHLLMKMWWGIFFLRIPSYLNSIFQSFNTTHVSVMDRGYFCLCILMFSLDQHF